MKKQNKKRERIIIIGIVLTALVGIGFIVFAPHVAIKQLGCLLFFISVVFGCSKYLTGPHIEARKREL